MCQYIFFRNGCTLLIPFLKTTLVRYNLPVKDLPILSVQFSEFHKFTKLGEHHQLIEELFHHPCKILCAYLQLLPVRTSPRQPLYTSIN